MKLHPVELERLTPEILHVFGRQPPLLTAGDKTGLNTMTIGWCQLGRLWNLPVCTVYVRPERYTYQFMESHDYFTVSILPEEAKKVTALCGGKSGRDVDKVKACGLTVRWGAGTRPSLTRRSGSWCAGSCTPRTWTLPACWGRGRSCPSTRRGRAAGTGSMWAKSWRPIKNKEFAWQRHRKYETQWCWWG